MFSESFFRNPLFPGVTFHEGAEHYSCPPFYARVPDSTELSNDDRDIKNIMKLVWLVVLLGCDARIVKEILNSYKTSPGFSNLCPGLISSLSASQTSVPDQKAVSSELPRPRPSQVTQGQASTPSKTISHKASKNFFRTRIRTFTPKNTKLS